MRLKMLAAAVLALPLAALGQSPIQWNGNPRGAIDRAREQQIPVLFWVTEAREVGDDDDLRDAQAESFRDPVVVAIAQHHYVPVRVSRNSRVLEEAGKLGLPTSHGLYVAIVTSDGKVLDQVDPGQVADPAAFAGRLAAAFRTYRDGLYQEKLRSVVTAKDAAKADVRRAVQTVWRLTILSADADLVGLLSRPDLVPVERQRLYALLASFATGPCVEALVAGAAAGDRDAANALGRAEAGALEFLLAQLPAGDAPTTAQIAAYEGAARIARRTPKPGTFWTTAKAEDRERELTSLKERAAAVLEYWTENTGRWR